VAVPGWRTDWLYRLVFREVADLWAEVRSGNPEMGRPPELLVIEELGGADCQTARCLPPVRRVWTFGPEGLQPRPGDEENLAACAGRRGMFWRVGLIRFHVAAGRRRVVFEYVVGPRYGRGLILRVAGQGKKGRLRPEAGPAWLS
jgi:hypothetical protein